MQGLFADKQQVQRLIAEQNWLMVIPDDPTVTPFGAREMMQASGIRPEDNEFAHGLIAAREVQSSNGNGPYFSLC